jgi:hypothetical protein
MGLTTLQVGDQVEQVGPTRSGGGKRGTVTRIGVRICVLWHTYAAGSPRRRPAEGWIDADRIRIVGSLAQPSDPSQT